MTGLGARIRAHVIDHIQSGTWRAGAAVPSESGFMALFGASRMTVHHALRELTAQGYLVRRKGSGTFVAPPQRYASHFPHRDVRDEIEEGGARHSALVVRQASDPADAAMAALFDCPAGAPLFHAVIVHCADGRPVELEDRHVHPAVLPGFLHMDLTNTTLFASLMLSHPLREGEETVGAIACDAADAALLGCEPGAAALEIRRISHTAQMIVTHARLLRVGAHASMRGTIAAA